MAVEKGELRNDTYSVSQFMANGGERKEIIGKIFCRPCKQVFSFDFSDIQPTPEAENAYKEESSLVCSCVRAQRGRQGCQHMTGGMTTLVCLPVDLRLFTEVSAFAVRPGNTNRCLRGWRPRPRKGRRTKPWPRRGEKYDKRELKTSRLDTGNMGPSSSTKFLVVRYGTHLIS